MSDTDAVHREAIAQTVLKFKWKESESSLKEHQFNEEYRSMRWFMNDQVRRDFEDAQHMLHCRSCMTTDTKTQNVRAPRLYIAIEKDQLGNVPAVSHLLCYNCGWEVYVNLPRDPRNTIQADMEEGLRQIMEESRRRSGKSIYAQYEAISGAIAKGHVDPLKGMSLLERLIEGQASPPILAPAQPTKWPPFT